MRVYLHLAEAGLLLSDLSLRVYSGGIPLHVSGLTLTPYDTSLIDYILDGLPEHVNDITLTYETPFGVYSTYRLGLADSQPLKVIIPIREVFTDPVNDLTIRLFKDDLETTPDNDDIIQLNMDGEYSVSGWAYTPIDQQWSVRWIYNDQVYTHSWTGTTRNGIVVPAEIFYQEIRATQQPFPYRVDGLNRIMFSCNYTVRAVSPALKFEDGIEQILRDAGKIDNDEMLYIGPLAVWPDDQSLDPYFVLIATGGYEPDTGHTSSRRENIGLQIITTSIDYETARARAYNIYLYLDSLGPISVTI